MKYADGLWLNKPGYGVNYATQMYEVTADETSVNVLATNQWIGNRGMTLGGPVLEITFTSTLENTIKVSIDHYKGRVHKSPDFQLNEDKSFRPVIKETDGAYELICRKGRRMGHQVLLQRQAAHQGRLAHHVLYHRGSVEDQRAHGKR